MAFENILLEVAQDLIQDAPHFSLDLGQIEPLEIPEARISDADNKINSAISSVMLDKVYFAENSVVSAMEDIEDRYNTLIDRINTVNLTQGPYKECKALLDTLTIEKDVALTHLDALTDGIKKARADGYLYPSEVNALNDTAGTVEEKIDKFFLTHEDLKQALDRGLKQRSI